MPAARGILARDRRATLISVPALASRAKGEPWEPGVDATVRSTGTELHPGDFALGSTMETVWIPDDLVGQVDGRSSVGRLAVVVHATAGLIDPGFKGQITLELSNIGRI